MARPRNALPTYSLHKPSGKARVRIDGRDIYLGQYGSDESRREYARLIALQAGGILVDQTPNRGNTTKQATAAISLLAGITVAELILAFWKHAETYYVKNGKPTTELACLKSALGPLKELFGLLPAAEFGPLALKAVRVKMVELKWTRKYVNKSIVRIRQVFRFGVANQMVAGTVLQDLKAVDALKEGRTEAPDRPKRHAIPQADIDKVRAVVRKRTRDIFDLLLATGARPGEILMLTTGMIDRTAAVWRAELHDHKMVHKGKVRVLYFGAAAQQILSQYLKADPDARLFPVGRTSFGHTIGNACIRAGVPRFTPHWLRHTFATAVRNSCGIEAAQAMLGHAKPDMTAQYSTDQEKRILEVVAKIG